MKEKDRGVGACDKVGGALILWEGLTCQKGSQVNLEQKVGLGSLGQRCTWGDPRCSRYSRVSLKVPSSCSRPLYVSHTRSRSSGPRKGETQSQQAHPPDLSPLHLFPTGPWCPWRTLTTIPKGLFAPTTRNPRVYMEPTIPISCQCREIKSFSESSGLPLHCPRAHLINSWDSQDHNLYAPLGRRNLLVNTNNNNYNS